MLKAAAPGATALGQADVAKEGLAIVEDQARRAAKQVVGEHRPVVLRPAQRQRCKEAEQVPRSTSHEARVQVGVFLRRPRPEPGQRLHKGHPRLAPAARHAARAAALAGLGCASSSRGASSSHGEEAPRGRGGEGRSAALRGRHDHRVRSIAHQLRVASGDVRGRLTLERLCVGVDDDVAVQREDD